MSVVLEKSAHKKAYTSINTLHVKTAVNWLWLLKFNFFDVERSEIRETWDAL